MNRLQSLAESSLPAHLDVLESEAPSRSRFVEPRDPRRAWTCHALFTPLHYEPGYAYPLIVWLHGPGDNENQLSRVMPLVSLRNYAAVGPRGSVALDEETGDGGYRWEQSEDHILLAEQRVQACVQLACEKYQVDPQRIFVGGLGCGGTMALRIALNDPLRFAGALSLGGPFPRGFCPLRHLDQVRRLPLFLATGEGNHHYAEARRAEDLRLFNTAGMSVMFRLYPCSDELTTVMLEDMNRWVMQIVCPQAAQAAEG